MLGPQTAVVVGEGEIDCDEYGRILVRFHWDREGANSMRCRVAQLWAGKEWGGLAVPRVGMEVVVEFMDGDPARPLVVGCVYNADNMPPFDVADGGKTMGMKSNSTPGGGGYNELAFDDTKGKEEVRLHAQYDLNAKVLHDETREVDNDRSTTIGNNDTLDVGQELTVTAGTKITLKVGMSTITMDALHHAQVPDHRGQGVAGVQVQRRHDLRTQGRRAHGHQGRAWSRSTRDGPAGPVQRQDANEGDGTARNPAIQDRTGAVRRPARDRRGHGGAPAPRRERDGFARGLLDGPPRRRR